MVHHIDFHLPPGSSASPLAHTCGFMGALLSEDTNWIYRCKPNWTSTFPHPNSGMALKAMVRNSRSMSSYEQHVGRCALILYADTWTVTNGRAVWSGSCKEHGWEAVKNNKNFTEEAQGWVMGVDIEHVSRTITYLRAWNLEEACTWQERWGLHLRI